MNRNVFVGACIAVLAACAGSPSDRLLGTLERERIAVSAEASEAILRVDVAEGDEVVAGASILSLDARRIDAELAGARAERRRAESALAELRRGTRPEPIAAARATLAGAEASATNARRERERIAEIRARGLVAQAELDRAETSVRNTRAQGDAARAQLAELLNGTRVEDIEQAEAALATATAAFDRLELTRARYDVRAPRAGRVDALPYRLGDQPPAGAVVVSLLGGDTYARVYVPASRRSAVTTGMRCQVHVQGVAMPFAARVRSVRADPAFTPYYALTGDDASRLAYRAELVLDARAADTPAVGLPVEAECEIEPRADPAR
jgi:HlyD family secretion protein